MRIFLSYGHDEYVSLAVRLKHDLQAQGNEVWFDRDRLKPGSDWERYIEDGLDFVSAIPDAGRVLLLLTPHSVRRPDGYCLNELARAFGRSLAVIPVMVSTVEPPLSICRQQYLDMRNCFPAEQHEERYAKQFGLLLKGLEEKQVPFEGVQQRLLNYLQPISYGDDLSRHLPRFIGREWVMTEVKEWLASQRRVLWITGDAGVGKSALAAWLCERRPEIGAYHFCRFGNSNRIDAQKALFSLAYQLSTQLPIYRDRLNTSPLDKIVVESNVPSVFDRLFVDPLKNIVPEEKPLVLLIDALDEATRNGRNELASLIGREFDRLPRWIRVIVTSRPYEKEINFALQSLDPWKLDAGRPENLGDLRKFLVRELRVFTGNGVPLKSIINGIVDKSEGLFLYVSWVCQELQDGRLSLEKIEQFPRGLGGVYADFFQRYFPDLDEYASGCRPALEAICAAREPLKHRDLAHVLGLPEYKMRSLIGKLGSLFPSADDSIRPFHRSLRDWLTNPESSGPYWIDVSAQEQRFADLSWREYKDGVQTMGRYWVTHAPSHLAACKKKPELKELLLDPAWIKAKLQAAGIVPLLADYDLALDILSSKSRMQTDEIVAGDPETNVLRMVQGALRLSSNPIARDPSQFASQMVGRLVPLHNMHAIELFATRIVAGTHTPWLQSLRSTLHPPGTALIRIFEGHAAPVWGVALSGDGRVAVSASLDKTLRVWEMASGRALRTLEGHSGFVRDVAVNGDGRQAISASADRTLKVWDVESGRTLRTLEGHTGAVSAVALSEDGRLAVSASEDCTLKVWDVGRGRALRTLEGHTGVVSGVAVDRDGRLAVSASGDCTLKVWDVGRGRALRTLKGHTDWVFGVALNRNRGQAVSASYDNTLKVWDVGSGRMLRTLKGHTGWVYRVALTEDGRRAISASDDETLRVWDVASGRALNTLKGHIGYVTGVAVTKDGRLAVSASEDCTLKVWDVRSGRALRTADHAGVVSGMAVSTDGQLLLASWFGPLRQFNLAHPPGTLKV